VTDLRPYIEGGGDASAAERVIGLRPFRGLLNDDVVDMKGSFRWALGRASRFAFAS
jgi:hypothetical protein